MSKSKSLEAYGNTIAFQKRFTKESDTWCTPLWITSALGWFDLDPCSNPFSCIRSDAYYSLETEHNGLILPWWGRVFVNPPYSRVLPWAKKAVHEMQVRKDIQITFLLKLDPTVNWYHFLMKHGGVSHPFRKRVKFTRPGTKSVAPQWPCTLITLGEILPPTMNPHIWRNVINEKS